MTGLGVFLYRRSQEGKAAKAAAQSWPGTMGTVLMSTVQSRRTGRSHSTYPVVVYQYQVNGQAQKTVNRYPVGAQVMVYYNPANPQESALER